MAVPSRFPDQSMTIQQLDTDQPFALGEWIVHPREGSVVSAGGNTRLEPRVMSLLQVLAAHGTALVPRDTLLARVWPDRVVGDDALARSLLKLRRALGDDARSPRYVETVPRRGYRLLQPPQPIAPQPIAPPSDAPPPRAPSSQPPRPDGPGTDVPPSDAPRPDGPATDAPWSTTPPDARGPGRIEEASSGAAAPCIDASAGPASSRRPPRVRPIAVAGALATTALLALAAGRLLLLPPAPSPAASTARLLERAHDYYYQFDRRANESAGTLYGRLLEAQPPLAGAKAGLANVLVQRVIRWPAGDVVVPVDRQNIAAARADGRLDTPWAQATLEHAERLAREAVATDAEDPYAHKALGLVLALRGERSAARDAYRRALALDPGMWEAWLNLGEIANHAGETQTALSHFVAAYEAMTRRYADDPQRIGRWQAELGVAIGETQLALGRSKAAQAWFRQVLAYAPLHPNATAGLAATLAQTGDAEGARAVCTALVTRIGPLKDCAPWLPGGQAPAPTPPPPDGEADPGRD